ncbi:TraR/DksA C4-type zinc finger protein [Candidatus Oleimmundimicrobium sp.]|uniref:TraR/DksA C4-type zinc finger protein n=1 Tax=Candidatus Oleimmundimicrobium sp. TaxID=3060597 RepID=UPI00271A3F05|nr:TraR/DksA C4-type zinc finger protein [Candidatus Oleimmundimicrobium sp.]MDO8885522.1 TraR/DksA C4-type zinc finger protein [Candidatus Oleimmundimicrobium sp.]
MILKEKLESEKRRLEEELKEIEEGNLKETQNETTGENSFEDNFADSGTATFEREKDLSLEINIKDLLSRVNGALERFKKGTYGKCFMCGGDIDPARLKSLPYADLCIECKKKEESSW